MDDIIVLISKISHVLDILSISNTCKRFNTVLRPLLKEYRSYYDILITSLDKSDIHCYLPKNLYYMCISYENVVYCAISYKDRLIYDYIQKLCKFESVIGMREGLDYYYKYICPNANINYVCRSLISNNHLKIALKKMNLSGDRLFSCTHTDICYCHNDLCHTYVVIY